MSKPNSFTLIELVIVIAILAILAAVIVIVINPAEYIKSARDSNRMSDLQNIHKSIGLYQADGGATMGFANKVYVSIPDSSDTCANLGLPTLPTGWSYACATEANLRKTDGAGWIPVPFSSISFGSALSSLPTDPINTTSTGEYYTYVTGSSWELNAILESQRYRFNSKIHKKNLPGVLAVGNNLSLSPIFNTSGLVGYWKFDEGNGTTAGDSSGYGNTGTLLPSGSEPTWTSGKVGEALSFDGVDDYVGVSQVLTTEMTASAWVKLTDFTKTPNMLINAYSHQTLAISPNRDGSGVIYIYIGNGTEWLCAPCITGSKNMKENVWHHVIFTSDGTKSILYLDSVNIGSSDYVPSGFGSYFRIGRGAADITEYLRGLIDEVRIYNRALSAAEVSALYNATNK